MKINDIVRIFKKPGGMNADVVGQVGYIEEIQEGYAMFQGLTLDGRSSGSGGIPVVCLVLETSKEWKNAYDVYTAKINKNIKNAETISSCVNEMLEEIGKKYNLTGQQIWDIKQEVDEKKEMILSQLQYEV